MSKPDKLRMKRSDGPRADQTTSDQQNQQEPGSARGPWEDVRDWAWEYVRTRAEDFLRQQARDYFGQETRDRMEEKQQQKDRERIRVETDEENLSEQDQLLQMRAELRQAGDTYMQSLRDSDLLVPGFVDAEPETELSATHKVYVQMMLRGCMRPLSQGVSPATVTEAAGSMAMMFMLSPNFRQEVGSYFDPVREHIGKRLDERTRSRAASGIEHQERLIEQRKTFFGNVKNPRLRDRLVGSENPEDHLGRRLRRRYEDLLHRERGHREMFTPTSAAMTRVALMEEAFWKCREEGADLRQVERGLSAMNQRLDEQFREDGLDEDEIARHARIIIGERMELEPETATMFSGLAHGRIVRSDGHDEPIPGTDRTRRVWTGEFESQTGRAMPEGGMFRFRRQMSPEEHQVQIQQVMTESMRHAVEHEGAQALAMNMQGYLVGHAARKEGLDTSGLPSTLRRRLRESEVMLASMDIDGHDDEEVQREVYSMAYRDSVRDIAGQYPQVKEDLTRALGPDWLERLQEAARDPHGFVDEQRRRQAGGQQDTGGKEQPGPDGQEQPDEDYQPV